MKKIHILILLIIILAGSLRLPWLASVPSGFHADEASFGYNSYSLLLTGKDEYGNRLPISLKSFGDYKGAVYAYLDIPFVAVFGLNEFSVRLPTAIIGILSVLLIYLIAQKLTGNIAISLITSVLSAISPVSIFLSRVQNDPFLSVLFVLLGFYCFLLFLDKGKYRFLFITGIIWIISLYTYASPRVFIPPFIILISIFFYKKIDKKKSKAIAIIFISIILLCLFTFIGNTAERVNQLSIFNTPDVRLKLEEKIREDEGSLLVVTRIFHNKIMDYGQYIIDTYFKYINYDFLFGRGGEPARNKTPDAALFYPIELLFFLFAVFQILSKKITWGYFSIAWFFIVPLILSFAVDETPNIHRFFLAFLPFELLVGFGIYTFYKSIKKKERLHKSFLMIIPLLFVANLAFYMHQLFVHEPVHRPWFRGYAYKELISSINTYYPNYKKIVITKAQSTPYIYILFYNKYSPVKYQKEGSPRDLDYTGFDKYYFVPLDCPLSAKSGTDEAEGKPGFLYINKGTCPVPLYNAKVLRTINWKDSSPAFKIIEYVSSQSAQQKKEL